MCTAIHLGGAYPTLGRTLDYEYTYGEEVVLLARRYPLEKIGVPEIPKHKIHYAILGMAHLADGVPLYYDALNEHGLAIAGLNFVGNASYSPPTQQAVECPPHALIPTLLAHAKSVDEALSLLASMTLVHRAFREEYPVAELHFLLADPSRSVVIEPMSDGVHVYENPTGVLTNNPPFPCQLASVSQYSHLSPYEPNLSEKARASSATSHIFQSICKEFVAFPPISAYTKGLGCVGLPGDYTSSSRFIRAARLSSFSTAATSEHDAIGQLFHLLDTVSLPRGSVRSDAGMDLTQYTSCMTLNIPSYTYTTATNRRPCRVCLSDFDLSGDTLLRFPLRQEEDILTESNPIAHSTSGA